MPPTSPAATLLVDALRERRVIIADTARRAAPEQHMQKLREISARIDRLSGELPRPVHPQLAHFLQRASYDKALEFLEAPAEVQP